MSASIAEQARQLVKKRMLASKTEREADKYQYILTALDQKRDYLQLADINTELQEERDHLKTMLRYEAIHELEQERDRYRQALEKIVSFGEAAMEGGAPYDIAGEALDA